MSRPKTAEKTRWLMWFLIIKLGKWLERGDFSIIWTLGIILGVISLLFSADKSYHVQLIHFSFIAICTLMYYLEKICWLLSRKRTGTEAKWFSSSLAKLIKEHQKS